MQKFYRAVTSRPKTVVLFFLVLAALRVLIVPAFVG